MRVRAMLGAQSFIGTPGNPAPEPRSATRAKPFTAEHPSALLRAGAEGAEEFFSVLPWLAGVGNRWRAAKRDSPKWRGAIFSGLRVAVRLMRAFQRRSISIYVDIYWSWVGDRTAGSSPGLWPCSE